MQLKALQKNCETYQPLMETLLELIDELVLHDSNLKKSGAIIDFSEYIFVLPAKEAARLFREKVAEKYIEFGGVLSLKTVQPEYFLYEATDKKLLSQVQIFNIWNNILANFDENLAPAIFSNQALSKNLDNMAWRLNMCEILHALRKEIALEQASSVSDFFQHILSIKDLDHQKNQILHTLSEKLEQYLTLETEFIQQKGENCVDEADLILHNLKRNVLSDKKVKKVILIDCSELKLSVIKALENLKNIDVELYLNTSLKELQLFDNYGRAQAKMAQELTINIDFQKQVRLYAKPSQMAKKIAQMISESPQNCPSYIGVLDAEITPSLEFLLKQQNLSVYSPKSYKLSNLVWTKLFLQLVGFNKEVLNFEDIANAIRNGLYINYLVNSKLVNDYAKLLRDCDNLQKEHLLTDSKNLEQFVQAKSDKYSELVAVLNNLQMIRQRIASSENIILETWQIVSEIGILNNLENLDLYLAELEIDALKKIISEVLEIENRDFRLEIFKYLIRTRQVESKGDNESAIDLTGFLEILWREDKKIILAGFNEENFNVSEANDLFLPESLREYLNFTCQNDRHASDIYHFYALTKAHEVAILVGKNNEKGDYLRPSRLLFYLESETLIKACGWIFSNQLDEVMVSNGVDKSYLPYQVNLTKAAKPKISVSAIKKYLTCPFQYYLENVLNANQLDDRNLEMDRAQIGSLLHKVLEYFGKLPNLKNIKISELDNFLRTQLQRLIRQEYFGNTQNSLIDIQIDNMEQILHNFAITQLEFMENKIDYQILATEKKFCFECRELIPNLDTELTPKVIFSGVIDRIDRYIEDGQIVYEIIDYKSSTKSKTPLGAHINLLNFDKVTDENSWKIFPIPNTLNAKEEAFEFLDLQLIIYRLILLNNLVENLTIEQEAVIRVAYCNLSLDFDACNFIRFADAQLFDVQALEITKRILERIYNKHIFWPPKLKGGYEAKYQEILGKVELSDFEIIT